MQRTACLLGCLDAVVILTKLQHYPPLPLAPPNLTEWNDSSVSSDKGLYRVDLSEAAGDRSNRLQVELWNGFIFQIHDMETNNITYIWQVSNNS